MDLPAPEPPIRPTVVALIGAAPYRVDIVAGDHVVVADELPERGGGGAGATPFALVLAGLAACTAIALRRHAEAQRWGELAVSVELRLEFGEVRDTIRRLICVRGAPSPEALDKLRQTADRTPVTLALRAGFEIETDLRPVPALTQ